MGIEEEEDEGEEEDSEDEEEVSSEEDDGFDEGEVQFEDIEDGDEGDDWGDDKGNSGEGDDKGKLTEDEREGMEDDGEERGLSCEFCCKHISLSLSVTSKREQISANSSKATRSFEVVDHREEELFNEDIFVSSSLLTLSCSPTWLLSSSLTPLLWSLSFSSLSSTESHCASLSKVTSSSC